MPTYALAASEGGHLDWAGLGYRIIVFAVFIGILYKFLRKPIVEAFIKRSEDIENSLNAAEHAKQEALEKVREYEEKSRQLEVELEEMKANVLKTAENERAIIIADAERSVERLKQNAINMINNETTQAKIAIKRELIAEVFSEAEKLITDEMKGAEAKAVLDSYIKRIGE